MPYSHGVRLVEYDTSSALDKVGVATSLVAIDLSNLSADDLRVPGLLGSRSEEQVLPRRVVKFCGKSRDPRCRAQS